MALMGTVGDSRNASSTLELVAWLEIIKSSSLLRESILREVVSRSKHRLRTSAPVDYNLVVRAC